MSARSVLLRLAAVSVALLLCAGGAAAQLSPGSWSARSSTGLVLMGTYTVVADSATGSVTGGWTLSDGRGQERARGAWSAAKAPRGWTGAWRSVAAGNSGEWSGTFRSTTTLKPTATLADLFTQAITDVIRGTWSTGVYSGSWAVRASP